LQALYKIKKDPTERLDPFDYVRDKLEVERHYAKTFLKKSFCTSKNFKKGYL
jgi:hypothetical protein